MSRVLTASAALLLVACGKEEPTAPAPAPSVAPTREAAERPHLVPQHAKRMLRGEAAKAKPEREPKRSKTPATEREPTASLEPAAPAASIEQVP